MSGDISRLQVELDCSDYPELFAELAKFPFDRLIRRFLEGPPNNGWWQDFEGKLYRLDIVRICELPDRPGEKSHVWRLQESTGPSGRGRYAEVTLSLMKGRLVKAER